MRVLPAVKNRRTVSCRRDSETRVHEFGSRTFPSRRLSAGGLVFALLCFLFCNFRLVTRVRSYARRMELLFHTGLWPNRDAISSEGSVAWSDGAWGAVLTGLVRRFTPVLGARFHLIPLLVVRGSVPLVRGGRRCASFGGSSFPVVRLAVSRSDCGPVLDIVRGDSLETDYWRLSTRVLPCRCV